MAATPHGGTTFPAKHLDGLRGLAIVGVIAFHTAVMATRGASWAGEAAPPAALWPVFAAKLGVDVFFVLSGFLVLRSWQRIRQRHPHAAAVREFAQRRAQRILPAFWVSLAVFIPMRVPEWLSSGDGLQRVALFAGVQQFLVPDLPHHVNVVTWSLTTEVHFYLLVPALAFALTRIGAPKLLTCLFAISIGWRLVCGGTGEQAEWIVGRIDQFAIGMAAATLVDAPRRASRAIDVAASRAGGIVLTAASLLIALPLGVWQLRDKPALYEATVHALAGVIIAAWLVRWSVRGAPSVLSSRGLVTMGNASYSLYLWHWPLLSEASSRWGPGGVPLAGALAASVIAAGASYLALERPAMRSRSVSVDAAPSAPGAGDQLAAAHR